MLQGIRIVEFEALGPAPFAGMLLADLGAEVIVVHRATLQEQPAKSERNLLDRGKKSIALDLKSSADLGIARALVRSADGMTEGMRPGVMERLGLGPDDLMEDHPELVYGRMTGWGQTGPRAFQAGHDLNYLGLAGALFYAGLPGEVPGVPPTMLGDIGAGAMYLAVGMLAALLKAQRTGKGAVVDAAIVDGASHMMSLLLSLGSQFSIHKRGASLLDGPHWSRVYRCACGGFIAVQCLEPKFYQLFLQNLGLADTPLFAKQFDPVLWPEQTAALSALIAAQTRAHWEDLFAECDACVAPVLSPADAQADPHIKARGIWHDGDPSPAPRFDGQIVIPGEISERGADGPELMKDLVMKGFL